MPVSGDVDPKVIYATNADGHHRTIVDGGVTTAILNATAATTTAANAVLIKEQTDRVTVEDGKVTIKLSNGLAGRWRIGGHIKGCGDRYP